jgi:uncharacterized protein YbbC (DUF1343 family)
MVSYIFSTFTFRNNTMKKIIFLIPFLIITFLTGCSQPTTVQQTTVNDSKIIPAAERLDAYLPLLKNKRVAVFANNTSMVQNVHLVDTLSRSGVDIKKIFAPEHGFRGTADAGEKVSNSKDPATGIAIVSLYGKKRKPNADDLADVDVIVFDIQDVGVRFFTYISSLEDLSEAAIEFNKPLIVLDRPNPNGDYVDGPVRKEGFRSFLGMQKVPVVYGMTIGEYAMMLKGEKWIDSAIRKKSRNDLNLTVIPCANYTHNSKYILPVKPSPNLPDMASVYLYPSTCFFEGTVLSEGRGTDRPFQMFGHPKLPDTLISFTPTSRQGARNTKLLGQKCYGWDLGGSNEKVLKETDRKLQFKWIKNAYQLFPGKDTFFLNNGKNFDRLAGNDSLRLQIMSGLPDEEIRKTWKPELDKFKIIRKKYLLYKDFE